MYDETFFIDNPDTTVSFTVPTIAWKTISESDSWKEIDTKVSKAQTRAAIERQMVNDKKMPTTIVHYAEVPMLQNAINKVNEMQQRMIISIVIPVISLIVSVIALLL